MLRVLLGAFDLYRVDWRPAIWGLAVLSLFVGSIAALVQTDVKRMLAYSSISHAGYILIGVQAATDEGTSAALFYLLAYALMVFGAFAVVTVVARRGDDDHSLAVVPRPRRAPAGARRACSRCSCSRRPAYRSRADSSPSSRCSTPRSTPGSTRSR